MQSLGVFRGIDIIAVFKMVQFRTGFSIKVPKLASDGQRSKVVTGGCLASCFYQPSLLKAMAPQTDITLTQG